jgi:hypothetical protein
LTHWKKFFCGKTKPEGNKGKSGVLVELLVEKFSDTKNFSTRKFTKSNQSAVTTAFEIAEARTGKILWLKPL